MVRHVRQTHPIDPARIYVAGLSAGGAMAAILASEYPDLFAAAGIHSGLAAGAAHDVASAFSVMKAGPAARPAPLAAATKRPTPAAPSAPVIVFHGDADSTVAAANGDAVIAAALAGRDAVGEALDAGPMRGTRRVRRTVWRTAESGTDAPTLAEQWVVGGAPHAWSGGSQAGSYTDPDGPDASREMVRFFLAHPRRAG
jgi:poly(3-hydroxybutyrate) depolymerase